MSSELKVLWLRPSTGENVSTRRTRIADHLIEKYGVSIDFQNVSIHNPITGVKSVVSADYDLAIANVRLPLYITYPFTTVIGAPLIGDVSDPLNQISNLPGPIYRALSQYEWRILRNSDRAIFAESDSYEEAKTRGIDAELQKNAVNFKLFSEPTSPSVDIALEEYEEAGISKSDRIAIYAGRFSQSYHLEEILEAADICSNWQFVFLGEGGMVSAIENADEKQSNIHYLGSYEHDIIPGFLKYANVGLCLVNAERPQKILELGASETPVLGMPGKLQREFGSDTMWFTEPSPRKISAALDRIENSDDDERVQNLMEVARQNSWESVADSYYRIIVDAANG